MSILHVRIQKKKCYECHKEFDRVNIYSEGEYVNDKWHCNLCIRDMNTENEGENNDANDSDDNTDTSTEEEHNTDDDYESDYHDDEDVTYIFGANYNETTNDENVANFNSIFNDSEDEENNNEVLL